MPTPMPMPMPAISPRSRVFAPEAMDLQPALHLPQGAARTPQDWIARHGAAASEGAALFFAPEVLAARLAAFQAGFAGQVTFAVKANPDARVLDQLIAGGIGGFDVASPAEIAQLRGLAPDIPLHYNNPVRSSGEVAFAIAHNVASYSVDCEGELIKLLSAPLPRGTEIAVRFHLPLAGGTYDFGAKFGAQAHEAVVLLQAVAAAGFTPALTFHVGTQCLRPAAWTAYVTAAAEIARSASVRIARLNVGGGFPALRDEARAGRAAGGDGPATDGGAGAEGGSAAWLLGDCFTAIAAGLAAFEHPPALVCEPGRGLVGDAFSYAVRVKSIRAGRVYLEDGIYGGLSEFLSMGVSGFHVLGPQGLPRLGAPLPRVVFGPTCDSLDRLPGDVALPADLAEGDWLVFRAMGAYVLGVNTRFNGYGRWRDVTVAALG